MRPSRRSTERARAGGDVLRRAVRHDERGSASLEFLTVGLILLVPLVYLVLAVAAVQGAAFAVEGAARHAARVAVLQRDAGEIDAAVSRAVSVALADYGVDADQASIDVDCADPGCLEPGSRVSVAVRAEVVLPFAPAVLDLDRLAVVPVEAHATQTVSRLAGPE